MVEEDRGEDLGGARRSHGHREERSAGEVKRRRTMGRSGWAEEAEKRSSDEEKL